MFAYCPACASRGIAFDGRAFRCPDCGFTYYHNTAAATGCLIVSGGRVLFLVRGREPGRGLLDFPGGFVDPGEGALDGLRRELREELNWEPPPGTAVTLLASFGNVYPYKGIDYNTCDLFFTVDAPGLAVEDLRLEASEIAGARFLRPGDVAPADLAFRSTRLALEAYKAAAGAAR